jgi:signal transduction histidine kinase
MNRLWVRLSIAFGLVVLLGVVSIAVSYIVLSRADLVDAPLQVWLEGPRGVLEQLARYYKKHEGWQDVETFLLGAESALPDSRVVLALHDSASGALFTAHPDLPAHPDESIPVLVEGQARATLDIFRNKALHITPNQSAFFLARLRDFVLVVAAIGSIVGIVFGVLVSRSLTAPLEQLATAAQAIGARELHRRVAIRGRASQEIVSVANAFNDMAAALEKGETLRRNLVADVAHELRTPLSVLQGNLLAILDGVYPLDTQEIARLYSQTHLLNRLVNDLHELSQAEAKQLRLNVQLVDVTHVLGSVVSAFGPTADEAQVHLELHVAPNLPRALLDPMRLTEVLDNLLGNALRHTPPGGTISLCAEVSGEDLVLTVKDTGEGISAEHLPHVFDRFYRTDRARSRATGGTGLGLAIVRAIVEMHGGQITATSDGVPGHGTTFTVRFPALEKT